ncbi:MAG: MotA/TolQ/ExbB proton channel family protein [Cocleimonas sp.]
MKNDNYYPFYGWLLIVGIICFGFFLLWDFGFLQKLLSGDITYLSSIILALFFAINIYLGFGAWQLSKQSHFASNIDEHPKSWASEHIKLLHWQRKQSTNESQALLARLIERVHRGHTTGWFFSDILIRLGLIGTVIGFVLMLSTIYQFKNNDIEALQSLLGTMGSGMQVALYTTLTGLGGAMLVSIQCQWLDRCADRLISNIIELGMQDKK